MSSELGKLMEEPAGGPNSGRRASSNPEVEGRHLPLGADEWQGAEFMRSGGWTVARVKDPVLSGMSGHRGVLHEDEYVDDETLRALVEAELGFTYEQVRSVYRQGRLAADQRELRGLIDARLLALSRSGGQMIELAKAFGWAIRPSGTDGGERSDTMERAIERARKEAS